jgi:formiminotetrahydrofolate cyclodeaminase
VHATTPELDRVVDAIAGLEPDASAGGGAAAACVAELAATLLARLARARPEWRDASGTAAQALRLQGRLRVLARNDARAYAAARAALGRGDRVLGPALETAARVPGEIAAAASDVVELAAEVATHGDPSLRADALAAAMFADAAARAAALLVEVNLSTRPGDELVEHARAACTAAAAVLARLQRLEP